MRFFAVVAAAALLAGCQNSTTGPGVAQSGKVPAASNAYVSVVPAQPVAGQVATLTDNGLLFSQDGYARLWTFSDGDTASGATVTHTFAAPGSYTVILDGTDSGATRSVSIDVTVAATGDSVVSLTGQMPPQPQLRQH